MCALSFSLKIAAQRLASVTEMHSMLATASAGCPVAQGELKATSGISSPWSGERFLEAPLQVQCKRYASSTHILLPGGESISARDMFGPLSSIKTVPWRLAVLPVASQHMTPDVIGLLSSITVVP